MSKPFAIVTASSEIGLALAGRGSGEKANE
jgi:hypothetical protein